MTFRFRCIALTPLIALLAACGGGAGDAQPTGHGAGGAEAAPAQCDQAADLAIANTKSETTTRFPTSDEVVSGRTKTELVNSCLQAKGFAAN